jgi:ribose transport system ATP-binding protein
MGWLDRRRMHAEAEQILARVGLDISPRTPLRALAMGQQQLVEIAKALSRAARVLIMDEPTSSLSPGEAEQLFALIEDLRRRGVSIVYVSHRLQEVEDLSDRVVVLRDGHNAGELARGAVEHTSMVKMMVGRDVSRFYARTPHNVGEAVLTVRDFVSPAWPAHRLNFEVNAGEVVALAGLVGAGRTELLRALFGIDRPLAGRVAVDGKEVPPGEPSAAIEAGLALVPEDRKQQGLVLDFPLRYNVTLANLDAQCGRGGLLAPRKENREAARQVDALTIKTPSLMQRSRFLSGGNQQKVVLGKWLSRTPRVLLMDEPTRGIDIGAKQEIYGLIESLAREGMAILFASSEMEEVLGLADRVLVMQEGRITGALPREALSEEAVMQLAVAQSSADGTADH